jgi:hypothetical protein
LGQSYSWFRTTFSLAVVEAEDAEAAVVVAGGRPRRVVRLPWEAEEEPQHAPQLDPRVARERPPGHHLAQERQHDPRLAQVERLVPLRAR